jgi:hypothetical protein
MCKSIKTAWKLACRRADLVNFRFHDLRREAGSRWIEGGMVLHEVSSRMLPRFKPKGLDCQTSRRTRRSAHSQTKEFSRCYALLSR